ncbi:MAG: RluA family pseudouridine synthase [Spirochaetaceae bacterium]|nr:RluA family pseudouridine synthase [Spirochaetaceae bacterium]
MLAAQDDDGRRLDRILRKALPDLPLSGIHRLLRKGAVLVDGQPAEAADRIKAGSVIALPGVSAGEGVRSLRKPAEKSAEACILWESPDLLVLNKPAGIAVHGPDSLDDLVQAYLRGKIAASLSFKPGPLHRLDTPTSGIIVFSKTLAGSRCFSGHLRDCRLRKTYLAVADGRVTGPAAWTEPLIRDKTLRKTFAAGTGASGRIAETLIRPLAVGDRYSLIAAEIRSGRTHQIRAHAGLHGHPLAGDRKYGGSVQKQGLLLHAYTLEFPADSIPGAPAVLRAPLPQAFRLRIAELFPEDAHLRDF